MTLEESSPLATLSPQEFQYIVEDPVKFDLFFYGVWDYWYQAPVIRDTHDAIAAVFGRQTGKCLHEDTEILCKNGEIKKIKELSEGEEIFGLSDNLKIIPQKITKIHTNGIKECYKVTTNYGFEIIATEEHPFRTFDQWKPLKTLKEKEHIAIPRCIKWYPKKVFNLKKYKIKILAYLLADGYTHKNGSIRFTNTSKKLRNEFIRCAKKFGDVHIIERKEPRNEVVTVEVSRRGHSRYTHNPVRAWLNKINYKLGKSIDKEIPSVIFTQDKRNLRIFLNRLFSCDGYVAISKDGSLSIGYSSSSKKMILQVRHLLLRFNINARVREKKIKTNNIWFTTYELSFGNKKDIINFAFNIGIKEKYDKLARIVKKVKDKVTNNNRDVIPLDIIKLISEEKIKLKKSWNELGLKRKPKKYNPQREKVLEYGQKLNSQKIINYAKSDVFWDRIKKIEYVGRFNTYNLTTESGNFIANDIFVHNSDIVSRRENYNGATNTLDDLIAILVAPAQRQSENLYSRCKKYLNRSPILLAELKEGRVLQKGIEFINGYTIVNMPIGQSADKVRGFSVDELVFEEAAFIPGAAYDALTDSLLSTAGTEIRIGTPFGKANPLYIAFENAFRIHTIPENRWEAWDITKDDMIIKKFDNVDMDDAWSCHHYPSQVGLNTYKDFQVYATEVWDMKLENDRRFAKQHRGWRVIKTENKMYIGQLLTEHWEVVEKLPQEVRIKYTSVKELLDSPIHVVVGFPQINPKRLKRQLKRPRNIVERENLALFNDDNGVVFPYEFVIRAFRKDISLWTHPRPGLDYYGGIDISKGVGGDYSVITIVAYDKPRVQLVYQWKSDRRRIKQVVKEVLRLHDIWHVTKWFIDSNTLGAMPLEELQDQLGSNTIDGIGFQIKDKAEMVANMEMLLGDHQNPCHIFIPYDMEELKHQFKFYTKQLSKDGTKLKYSHPDWEGEHDDELESLMLACLCAKSIPTIDLECYFVDPIW